MERLNTCNVAIVIAFALVAALVAPAHAGIVVHGSTTAWQEIGGDWLSMGTNDIDGSGGLGSDGFIFYDDFDGNTGGGLPYAAANYADSLPSYISSHVAGANFNIIGSFPDMDPAGIDDPVALDGSNTRSGVAVGPDGVAGNVQEIVKFTVSGLPAAATVRVGVFSGNQGPPDGRWQPASITLSDGTNSATVGDYLTSPLAPSPGGSTTGPNAIFTRGWVFFDIDANGTYALSGTVRDLPTDADEKGAGFGGLTFDSVVPAPSALPAGLAMLALGAMRRRRA